MYKKIRSMLAVLLAAVILWTDLCAGLVYAEESIQESKVQISAPAALLMEASTGQVIYEKNADERRSPASITKIMTML